MDNYLIYDTQLLDALRTNDSNAFEELYNRHWFQLFQYANGKLNSEEVARLIVRDIFIELWETRASIPANFSLIVHLYSRVRKMVATELYKQISEESIEIDRKENLVAEFSFKRLQQAYKPAASHSRIEDKYGKTVEEPLQYPLIYTLKKRIHNSWSTGLRILLHDLPAGFSRTFL